MTYTCLQCPHHGAMNSTKNAASESAAMRLSKLAAVSSSTLLAVTVEREASVERSERSASAVAAAERR